MCNTVSPHSGGGRYQLIGMGTRVSSDANMPHTVYTLRNCTCLSRDTSSGPRATEYTSDLLLSFFLAYLWSIRTESLVGYGLHTS